MKPISSLIHGLLDYVIAIALYAVPRLLDWPSAATTTLTVLAVVLLVCSLLTRYEMSAFGRIPMTAHLAVDVALAVALGISAALLPVSPGVQALLAGTAVFMLILVPLTRPVPEVPKAVEGPEAEKPEEPAERAA